MLAETARRRQENVGWKIVTDAGTGVAARHPDQAGAAAGQRRQRHQMDFADRHHPDAADAAQGSQPDHGETRRAGEEGAAARTVDYTVVKPDFFVLSGLQGLKKFYLRGTFKGDEVRILTILYDQATENTVEPVVIAMSSAFNAFPTGAQAGRRRARPSNTAPASSSATTAPSSPTARSPTAAWRSRSPGFGNADRRRRGQGSRSRAAAHLWRARTEAAGARRRRGEVERRHHRHRRSAEPGRRRGGRAASRRR